MSNIEMSGLYKCTKTNHICVGLRGDDKVWCGGCVRTHLPEEMVRLSEEQTDLFLSDTDKYIQNRK